MTSLKLYQNPTLEVVEFDLERGGIRLTIIGFYYIILAFFIAIGEWIRTRKFWWWIPIIVFAVATIIIQKLALNSVKKTDDKQRDQINFYKKCIKGQYYRRITL